MLSLADSGVEAVQLLQQGFAAEQGLIVEPQPVPGGLEQPVQGARAQCSSQQQPAAASSSQQGQCKHGEVDG